MGKSVKRVAKKWVRDFRSDPESAMDRLNLTYISDDKMPIIRKRWGKGFSYSLDGKKLKNEELRKRIDSLVIPPAWEQVKITNIPNGHLQAVGIDGKGRKQYIYHPEWHEIRNQSKFMMMVSFGKALPGIREQVEKDLKQRKWTQSKVVALVIRLMEETHIRIGNEQYAKRNQSYGLTTLRKKHLSRESGKLCFEFTGKTGKLHCVTLNDKKLVRLVSRCEEIPGWELFKYYDENGEKKVLESNMINEYLREYGGDFFTAKDFRTWAASVIFFNTLMELGIAQEEGEKKKNIQTALNTAANALGNTKKVCGDYYVHPHLVNCYENCSIAPYFDRAQDKRNQKAEFSAAESQMLLLLEDYVPEFLNIRDKKEING